MSDGLSSQWVRCFYQDEQGLMWIGTSDSFDRYDGREIKSYRPTSNKSGGQQRITVNEIIGKGPGVLWLATDTGAYIFDQEQETFTEIDGLGERPILDVMEDSKGRSWFCSDLGLFVMDDEEGEIHKFAPDLEGDFALPHKYVNTIFEDSTGKYWIGTKGGLSVFDESIRKLTTYVKDTSQGSLFSNNVLDFAEDQQGRVWLATSQGGLELAVPQESGDLHFRVVSGGLGIHVMVDSKNSLWLAKGGSGGLIRLDLGSFDEIGEAAIKRYGRELENEWSLSDDSVVTVYQDSLGDIWVGTLGSGVDYLSMRNKRFNVERKGGALGRSISENVINCFFEEEDYLWIGTIYGLERRNKSDGTFKRFLSVVDDDTSLGNNSIYSIFKDSRGNLWVGGWTAGLNRYNYETDAFERYVLDDNPSSNVFKIVEDSRGNLWVGTIGGGLNRYVYETGEFEQFVNEPDNAKSISADSINDILNARSGDLYISTYGSLDRFDYDTGEFIHIEHEANIDNGNGGGEIVSLFEDSLNRIWLATTTGLELFDSKSGTFKVFTVRDGLPTDSIQAMLEDSDGSLWISTSRGLSKYENAIRNPSDARFRNITKEEGLSSNQFNRRAAYIGFDGIFYFGSTNGITSFRPEEIIFNEVPPPIVLTEMMNLVTSPDSLLSYRSIGKNINQVNKLELLYSEYDFIIKFAALNFLNPEKNQYRYKLEGYDRDWVNAGTSGSATYTHISPGDYKFHVRGSNNDGVWSQETKTLAISIMPPWWGTLWFRVSLAILLVGFLVFAYSVRFAMLRRQRVVLEKRVRERTSRLKDANRLLGEKQEEIATQNRELFTHREHLEQMVKERTKELETAKERAEESDQLKSSFLMNMSHEVRTPMNAIIGFSTLLKRAELSQEDREKFVEVIDQNGRALLVLIDDILDISLIQSDRMRLTYETFYVDNILYELRDLYQLKNDKDVGVNLVNEDQVRGLKLTTDPVRFRQILNNLLSNAYKYTDSGEVEFGCTMLEGEVLFEVSDTGLGIDKDDLQKVFSHFYKVEANNARLYP